MNETRERECVACASSFGLIEMERCGDELMGKEGGVSVDAVDEVGV